MSERRPEPPDRRVEPFDQAAVEARLREIATGLHGDRWIADEELRHLIRVVTGCSLLVDDVYSPARIERIMHPERGSLSYLVRRFFSFYARRPQMSRILIKELYVDLKNAERIGNAFQRDIGKLEALFEKARQRGELDPGTDTGDAVLMWWSYYAFVLFRALQLPAFDVDEQVAVFERLFDQHLRGIGIGSA